MDDADAGVEELLGPGGGGAEVEGPDLPGAVAEQLEAEETGQTRKRAGSRSRGSAGRRATRSCWDQGVALNQGRTNGAEQGNDVREGGRKGKDRGGGSGGEKLEKGYRQRRR